MSPIFITDSQGDEPERGPPVSDVAKLYEGGPWVVRAKLKGKKEWFYQSISDPKHLRSLLGIEDMVTFNDPFVAEGVRMNRQDRYKKGERRYEVVTLDCIRDERKLSKW